MNGLSEEQKRNLENDWGELAPRSDFRPGDSLRYTADGSTWRGTIVWVTGPGESRIEGRDPLPLRYIVEREGWHDSIPDVVYSFQIITGEPEEPTLEPCPWCGPGTFHYKGMSQYCPKNPNR